MELILTPLIVDIMKKKSDSDKQLDWMSDM